MRVLFAHPTVVAKSSHEGGHKAFKALIAGFAGAGHECEVVSVGAGREPDVDEWRRVCAVRATDERPIRFALARPSWKNAAFAALLRRRIAGFAPDRVVVENGTFDARLALLVAGQRLALSVSTTASLPFGPRSSAAPRPWGSLPYAHVGRIFCASRFIRGYIREHAGVDAFVQPLLAYGKGPYAPCASFDAARVTMINPAPHKGGAIFRDLAQKRRDLRFRAVQTYANPVSGLGELDNVEIVPSSDDLDAVLADTTLLLVPSMWGEGWGMVCVDAMLRGIPVLASDDGALPDATLGVGTCVPPRPGHLRQRRSGAVEFTGMPVELEAWTAALDAAIGDREHWQAQSRLSRDAALAFVATLSVDALAAYLSA